MSDALNSGALKSGVPKMAAPPFVGAMNRVVSSPLALWGIFPVSAEDVLINFELERICNLYLERLFTVSTDLEEGSRGRHQRDGR